MYAYCIKIKALCILHANHTVSFHVLVVAFGLLVFSLVRTDLLLLFPFVCVVSAAAHTVSFTFLLLLLFLKKWCYLSCPHWFIVVIPFFVVVSAAAAAAAAALVNRRNGSLAGMRRRSQLRELQWKDVSDDRVLRRSGGRRETSAKTRRQLDLTRQERPDRGPLGSGRRPRWLVAMDAARRRRRGHTRFPERLDAAYEGGVLERKRGGRWSAHQQTGRRQQGGQLRQDSANGGFYERPLQSRALVGGKGRRYLQKEPRGQNTFGLRSVVRQAAHNQLSVVPTAEGREAEKGEIGGGDEEDTNQSRLIVFTSTAMSKDDGFNGNIYKYESYLIRTSELITQILYYLNLTFFSVLLLFHLVVPVDV